MSDRFELTPDEIRSLETFHRLPEFAMERLGNDPERNDRILSAVATAPEQSILIFATSVAHANRLAARLTLLGIRQQRCQEKRTEARDAGSSTGSDEATSGCFAITRR